MSQIQRKYEKPWFFEMAAILIAEPSLTNLELGERLNRKPVTVSIVRNSDMFRDMFARMQKEYFDEFKEKVVEIKLSDKVAALADVSVEALTKRVVEEGALFPTDALLSTTKLALGSLGFGASPSGDSGNRSSPNLHIHVGDTNVIAQARERMQEVRAISKERVISGEVAGEEGGSNEADALNEPDENSEEDREEEQKSLMRAAG